MFIGKYHIGLRTVKTCLAVMSCIIYFHLTHRGTPVVATLATVFILREDLTNTLDFGKARIIGNTVGGLNAVIYTFFYQFFSNKNLAETLLIPLLVGVTITVSIRMGNKKGLIGSIATLLFICFSIPQEQSIMYALSRVIDTFIGAFFALFWNLLIKPPIAADSPEEHSIEAKEALIQQKQRDIDVLQKEIDDIEFTLKND